MSEWTRANANRLAELAMQIALSPKDVMYALEIGARIKAQGFTPKEIDRMILRQFRERAEDEERWNVRTKEWVPLSVYCRLKDRGFFDD